MERRFDMSKIAVIFPGVGYNKDRPLLYYAGKLAGKSGYELRFVDFSGIKWSKEQLKDRAFLLKTLETCLKMTEDALKDAGDMASDEVIFISKSIGTVVSLAYAKEREIRPIQIFFSPLEMISDFVDDKGAVLFCGDDDPMADHKVLEEIALEKHLEIHMIAGGNHSLETGDVSADIDNLKIMMQRVGEVISQAH